jgi:ElaB/YqjD/DUF883 family membrane-anchored ribosome-binding protein
MESRVEGSTTAGEAPGVTADKVVNELKALIHRAEQQAAERAKAADRLVRAHPYETVGLAFGIGLLAGILIRRK